MRENTNGNTGSSRPRRLAAFLLVMTILLLYIAACALPAVCFQSSKKLEDRTGPFHLLFVPADRPEMRYLPPGSVERSIFPGYEALFSGWFPPYCVPWSANLVLLAGLICAACGKFEVASKLGIICSGLAMTTWLFYFAYSMVPLEGYYLWQGSMLALWLGARKIASGSPQSGSPSIR